MSQMENPSARGSTVEPGGQEPEGESVTQLPRKKDDEPRGDSETSETR